MFGIGTQEMLLILVLALIIFGPKKLPEMGRSIGKSLREFNRATQDIRDELRFNLDADEDASAGNGSGPASTDVGPTSTDVASTEFGGAKSADQGGASTPSTKPPAGTEPKSPEPGPTS